MTKKKPLPTVEVAKGDSLSVKAPPYFDKEYTYEVTSAGDRQIRATLKGSSKVKKLWERTEFALLVGMGMIKILPSSKSEQ